MSGNIAALRGRLLGEPKSAGEWLGHVLKREGRIGPADIDRGARETGLPAQALRAVAEFYDQLAPTGIAPPRLRVCDGEACRAAGADALAATFADRLNGAAGRVTCLGLCSGGPNLSLDGQGVRADSPATVDAVVAAVRTDISWPHPEPENPIHLPGPGQPCLLLRCLRDAAGGRAVGYPAAGYAALARAESLGPAAVRAELRASRLRGRGGAGFPIGRKLETVAAAPSPDGRRYVVANLDEGDAGAYIDKELAERDPHALIEGLLIAAFACNADRGYIYVRHEYPRAAAILERAIAEARAAGHGACALGVVEGKGSYVCGEETALLRSIEGLPGQVSVRPPYPAERGLWGRPTAVNNVETLCNLPWILANGGGAFAAIGTAGSTGTKLVSLNHRVRRPGLYEVAMGTPLREMLFERAGGMADGHRFRAVQIGGPLGAFLPEGALDVAVSFEGLAEAGGTLGHGGMVVFSDRDDLAAIARGLMAFCARESCGKCFPCRIGSVRMVELLDRIVGTGMTAGREALLRDLCETMRLGSLCGLGGMAPVPIESLLEHFPDSWRRSGGGADG